MSNSQKLKGKRVAILATDGFEQSELFKPRKELLEAGAEVDIVSIEEGSIKGWDMDDWGKSIDVDKSLENVNESDYHALVLPGGLFNPDTLRNTPKAVDFVRSFFNGNSNKPVAAICHGPWLLAEADVIRGREVTSYPSIQTDLKNAGATWTDNEVIVDKGLVTSRKPDDISAFNEKLIAEICEGRNSGAA